jgi:protein-tyrosine phosphatase
VPVDEAMEPPRLIALEGASNVRDLGGWPAAGGARVRFGAVFRSASLEGLTRGDAIRLGRTGLRTVVDLRGEVEQQRAPSRLDVLAGAALYPLPIEPSLGGPRRSAAPVRPATAAEALEMMRRAYTSYALDWSHRYAALFDLLLDAARRPLLFHCTAGKDRTGFGAALLLAALGVSWEAIRADYLATDRLWQADAHIRSIMPAEVADVLLGVHGELLDVAFASIRTACGSLDAYLEQRIGLDATRREGLRAALLS